GRVRRLDPLAPLEMGDRARNAQRAMKRACSELELLECRLEQSAGARCEAYGAELGGREVAVQLSRTIELAGSRTSDPRGSRSGALAFSRWDGRAELARRHARHGDVQIDAIQERTGNARTI